MKLIIQGRLPSLNEYTLKCRYNRFAGAKMKKDAQEKVCIAIRGSKLKIIKNYPISLNFTWYEPNKKRDIDNVIFGEKFVLDALVEMGILINDSQKYVTQVSHEVKTDKENPRIEVELNEVSIES